LVDARLPLPGREEVDEQNVASSQNGLFKFAPDNGLAFFENLGWRVLEAESQFVAARRLRRLPASLRPRAWLPQPDLRNPGSTRPWGATALLPRDRFG